LRKTEVYFLSPVEPKNALPNSQKVHCTYITKASSIVKGEESLFILRRAQCQLVEYMGEFFLNFKPSGT